MDTPQRNSFNCPVFTLDKEIHRRDLRNWVFIHASSFSFDTDKNVIHSYSLHDKRRIQISNLHVFAHSKIRFYSSPFASITPHSSSFLSSPFLSLIRSLHSHLDWFSSSMDCTVCNLPFIWEDGVQVPSPSPVPPLSTVLFSSFPVCTLSV